jgi:alanyl-tRNA synthetase
VSGTGTPRRYFDDPWLTRFDARVIAHGQWSGAASVLLDATAFYPEAGGQMADRGHLGDCAVIDVQVDDADLVHHLLDGPLPPIGAEVEGLVDRPRRRVHMALHTGQHMLSRALRDEAGGETVSSRLGESVCTIDLDLETVDEAAVARAEALVNAVIDDDVRIRAFFPDAAELAALPLRRRPKVDDLIRVVQIGDFDVSPCGGTHCTASGQVGLVRVLGVERQKGKARISFDAGPRARAALLAEGGLVARLARDMSCGPSGVAGAIDKLRAELQGARARLGQAQRDLAERMGRELGDDARARGARFVAQVLPGDVDFLRLVAKVLCKDPDAVVLLAVREADAQRVLVARGERAAFDCGVWLRRTLATVGAKGGGRKDSAEGLVGLEVDWLDLVGRDPPA